MTPDGNLYDVDMRLRPSGTQGPVASSLAAFERYHRELAWTWEQMALTRARVVTGAETLADRARAVVGAVLRQQREQRPLAREVVEMRQRMAAQHRDPPFWDLKHRRGGLIDIEFIAQYLQLREAAQHPETLRQNTTEALLALARAGALDAAAAADLVAALRLWRNLQGLIKLTVDEPFDEDAAAPALKQLLARGAGAVDFAGLKTDMESAAQKSDRPLPRHRRGGGGAGGGRKPHEHRDRRQGAGLHLADRRQRQDQPVEAARRARSFSTSIPRTIPRAAPPRPAAFATASRNSARSRRR